MPITKAGFSGRGEEIRAAKDTVTIKAKKGEPAIKFKKGGLHESLGVPEGEPIPPEKMAAAKAGRYGPKAQKQANFAGALEKMRPEGRGTLRTLGPAAGAMLEPTAVLGSNKKRPGGQK